MTHDALDFAALLIISSPSPEGSGPTTVLTVADLACPAFKLAKHTRYSIARILAADLNPIVRISLDTHLTLQLAELPAGAMVSETMLVEQLLRVLKSKP